MSRLLIIIYKNKNVTTREEVRDVDILTGTNGQSVCFDEYDLNTHNHWDLKGESKYIWHKNRTISLSGVKKVVYDGVTIWEADE